MQLQLRSRGRLFNRLCSRSETILLSFRAESRNLWLFLSMPRDYNFWVYMMTNQLESVLYIGMTNNLSRRVTEHRSGEIPGFTRDYKCHKLAYWEHYSDVEEAIAREKQLKKWSRKKKVELIERSNPRWFDLFEEISGNV